MQRPRAHYLISLWMLVLFTLPACTFDTSGPAPSSLYEFGMSDLGLDSDMELIDSEVRDLPDMGVSDLDDASPPPDAADMTPPDMPDMAPPDMADIGVVDVLVPDMPVPDLPVPDMPVPDMLIPDFPVPDMPVPDMPVPDMMIPDMSVPDLLTPDKMLPDQSIKLDSGAGGPCPCAPGLVCMYNACRVKCTRDACRQSSACKASESCTQQGANLGCMAGLTAYAPCQIQPFGCPQGHYCAKNTSGIFQCLPLCTVSSSTCPCAKLSGTSCSVCRQ